MPLFRQKKQADSDILNSYICFFFDPSAEEKLIQHALGCADEREQIFDLYFMEQCEKRMLDYEDMLQYALYALLSDCDFLAEQRAQFAYILCDEYQDVNEKQDRLMHLLCGSGNLTVVGDYDQNIYSWRGADPRFIRDFAAKAADSNDDRVLFLTENFRSTPEILAVADCVIEKNKLRIRRAEQKMRAFRPAGSKPGFQIFDSAEEEAARIAAYIHEHDLRDAAILVRIHHQLPAFRSALAANSIFWTEDENNAPVKLLTIHAAKGSEFDTVFIPGMVEGQFPASVRTESEFEEERRLFFVAVTRAKRQLFISTYRGEAPGPRVRPPCSATSSPLFCRSHKKQHFYTAKYLSVKADRTVGTILGMGLDGALLFARGSKAQLTEKYDLTEHPAYAAACRAAHAYKPNNHHKQQIHYESEENHEKSDIPSSAL